MKDILAPIYEKLFGLYDQNFSLVFDHLYNNGGYLKFGFSFILIPLILLGVFYYVWKYPYGKILHWLLWLVVIIIIVFGMTYSIANTEIFASGNQALNAAIDDASTGYKNYASSLPLQYALYNSLLTLVIGIIYSLILKQFSKIQIHLPF